MSFIRQLSQVITAANKSLNVYRAVRDVYPTKVNHRHPGDGIFGAGTYFALDLEDAEVYGIEDLSGEMDKWSIVTEYKFSGRVKTLYAADLLDLNPNTGIIDLKKRFPKDSAFLLLQDDSDYNPPDGGEQLLVTKKSLANVKPTKFWIYFKDEKMARNFAKAFKIKAGAYFSFGPFKMSEGKKVEDWLKTSLSTTFRA